MFGFDVRIVKLAGQWSLSIAHHWVSVHRSTRPWSVGKIRWPFITAAPKRLRRARAWTLGWWEVIILPQQD